MTQIPSSGQIGLIRLRQGLLPPLPGRSCRFTPLGNLTMCNVQVDGRSTPYRLLGLLRSRS